MFSKKFIIIHICFICIIGILSSSAVVFATSNQNINPSSDYATTDSIAINYNNYSHPANQNSNINHSYTVKSSKNIDTYEPSLSKNIRNNKYQLAKSSNNIT